MPLRLKMIRTADGSDVQFGRLTILVGPNNCGKSQTLRDIRDYVTTGIAERLVIVKECDLGFPSETEALAGILMLPHQSNPQLRRFLGVSSDLQGRQEFGAPERWIGEQYSNRNWPVVLQQLGRFWVAHLDAESRFRLAGPTECYDVRGDSPTNAMQVFFRNRKTALEELRDAFKGAFGCDIALDWAGMKRWCLRVGGPFGEIPDDLHGLDELLKDQQELAVQGDGYRSFAGVVVATLTFPDRLALVDEPEAFLHPAQARFLGRWLAENAKGQMLVATHDFNFLWGAISAGADVQVVRLNRTGNRTRYDVVPAETCRSLLQSPLLSSQPVLDSMFQRGVVICEGDPDRAIYQTVAHVRLVDSGGEDAFFIHSNGKDAMHIPVSLLRTAKIPVCAIADIDVFNSETVLERLLQALGATDMEEILRLRREVAQTVEDAGDEVLLQRLLEDVVAWQAGPHLDLRDARKELEGIARRASKWGTVKARGLDAFDDADTRKKAESLISACAKHDLFVVPKGELEAWMNLGAAKGREWNRRALEELHAGQCPQDLHEFVKGVLNRLLPGRNANGNPGENKRA